MNGVELWGGIECTLNRVGERYHSQLELSGHDRRPDDLAAVADLGIRTLRYPLLWEMADTGASDSPHWGWFERRFAEMQRLRITPIVGLLHHGSGPSYTNLLDAEFAPHFTRYAQRVAQHFPQLQYYTPINEPLTTARFSCLYGFWYPHVRSDQALVRSLLNQCRATVLAMQAIRKINPAARLIQTEDLGKVHSSPSLRSQAAFENERRWLTWDLLCGRVDASHGLWAYLIGAGADAEDLLWFSRNPCPPDVIGINYYVTSQRFLHDRPDLFPLECRGGNGREQYADIEAVRVQDCGPGTGIGALLADAWNRYQRPLAITEAHLGCSREEQMRWFYELWHEVQQERIRGVDVRAVTSWALFGSFDWNTLLTQFTGSYEPGAFDVRGPHPRRTALGQLVRDFALNREPKHSALLRSPGWWHRPGRLLGMAADASTHTSVQHAPAKQRPLVIVGATGTLGQAFERLCEVRGLTCVSTHRSRLDIRQGTSWTAQLDAMQPWALVNAAGYVKVDEAEANPDQCFQANYELPKNLAHYCADRGIQWVTFSSDLVFDGARSSPYREADLVHPLNVYGRSKVAAEEAVLRIDPKALIIRSSAFFGPWDAHNFLAVTLRRLASGRVVHAATDVVVSPTYVPDLVAACLDLLLDGESGIWHLANQGALTWDSFARQAAERMGVSSKGLRGVSSAELGYPARRPGYSALTSGRGNLLPPLEQSLESFCRSVMGRLKLAA